MSIGKILIAVAGIATGALAGILFAPAKGRKTRKRLLKKLKRKSYKMGELVAVKFGNLVDDVFFDDKNISKPEDAELHYSQVI